MTDEVQSTSKEDSAATVLQGFYEDLQNELPIDELLPQIVTKRIITIQDKILITESAKTINERAKFFLDHYISKPMSRGDDSAFYKLLQVLNSTSKCPVIVAKIKQCLQLQDKISGMSVVCGTYKNDVEFCCLLFNLWLKTS